MKVETRRTLLAFGVELVVYTILVLIYFFLVLHLLGDSLARLEANSVALYAVVAVGLVLGQGVLLDWLTHALLRLIRRRAE